MLKINRRNLLSGVASSSVLVAFPEVKASSPHGADAPTIFSQGALGGGGFVTNIVISADGLTRMVSSDVNTANIYNSSTQKWDSLISHDRVPTAYNTVTGMGAYALAFAPSLSSRIYILASGAFGSNPILSLWRSDNRGATFTDTGIISVGGDLNNRYMGPKLIVDPNNPDVVYWGNAAGLIYRSLDGGATIHDSGKFISPLAGALVTGTTNAAGTVSLPFAPTPVALQGFATHNVAYTTTICAYDATTPAAVGTGTCSPQVTNITSTTVTLANNLTGGGCLNGDLVYFGAGPVIVFDLTSGTTTLGGKTVTKGIYVGWAWGATAVWQSTDGGATFAAMGSGPNSVRRMSCSDDGVIYASDNTPRGNNVLTAHNFWRYVTPTSTNTSSLTTGWTNFTNITGAPQNGYVASAPDPLNAGHVATTSDSGNINYSTDYGQRWSERGAGRAVYATSMGADVQWLVNATIGSLSGGNICFDTQVSGRLWNATGIGIYFTDNAAGSAGIGPAFAPHTLDNNELIVTNIIKVPNGGPICCCVEDRTFMILTDPTVGPVDNMPYQSCWIGFIDDGSGIPFGTPSNVPGNILTVTSVINGPIYLGLFATIVGTGVANQSRCDAQSVFAGSGTGTISGATLTISGATGTWYPHSTVSYRGAPNNLASIMPYGTGGSTGNGGDGTYALNFAPGNIGPLTMKCSGNIGKYTVVSPAAASQNVASTTMGAHWNFFPIVHAWGIDYAKTDPTFIVGAAGNYDSAIWTSHNSGSQYSWSYSGFTSTGRTVHPAVQSPTHYILGPINVNNVTTDTLLYTTDGVNFSAPSSWTLSVANGGSALPMQLCGGFGGTQFAFRNIMQADPNNSSTYYAYNFASCGLISGSVNTGGTGYAVNDTINLVYNPNGASATVKVTSIGAGGSVVAFSIVNMGGGQRTSTKTMSQSTTSGSGTGFVANTTVAPYGGFWKSTDNGATWVQQSNPLTLDRLQNYYIINVSSCATLVPVPGHSGHLFYADGTNGSFQAHLYFSADGGVTVVHTSDATITQAMLVAVGKAKPGASYPSIFLYGKANGDTATGYYRCDDFDPNHPTTSGTWQLLTNYPAGSLDTPSGMAGDLDTWGTLYIGMQSTGYIYGAIH
jgi:hypothetical protein